MAELKTEDGCEKRKKRVRDEFLGDSEANSPDPKLARVDSVDSDANLDGTGVSSPEAKRIQDDLLSFLDDADPDPAIQGLDSLIRSFEEEIHVPEQEPPPVVTSDAGESREELGFLLQASDDELGLPPSFPAGEEQKIEAVDLHDMEVGFENEIPSYEPYDLGINCHSDDGKVNASNDFITLDGGLFDSYEPDDISEFPWRPESLSAS